MDQYLELLSSVAIAIDFANNGYDIDKHYVINRLLANQHYIFCRLSLLEGNCYPINIMSLTDCYPINIQITRTSDIKN